jgi:predicted DCC family thiol-disulfide oxidoreductase YuxK
MSEPPAPDLTVCYNGFCPVCRTEIRQYRRLAEGAGAPLGWVDVVADPQALAKHGLDFDTLLRRLHAVDAQGRLYRGVDAFAMLWRRLPYYRHLARLMDFRLGRALAWLVYEGLIAPPLYAVNRRRLKRRGRV